MTWIQFDKINSPTEANQNGQNRKNQNATVWTISKEYGQPVEWWLHNQDKEENQANERSDQCQQAEEEPLRRSNAINTTWTRSLSHGNSATRQHHFQTMLQIFFVTLCIAANVLPHHVNNNGTWSEQMKCFLFRYWTKKEIDLELEANDCRATFSKNIFFQNTHQSMSIQQWMDTSMELSLAQWFPWY